MQHERDIHLSRHDPAHVAEIGGVKALLIQALSGVHAGSKPDPSLCASPAGSLSQLEDFSLSTLGLVSTGSSPPSPPPPLEYCVGVEPAQKSVRASTSASAAYLNEQLLAAIDRAASHPRADTSLAVIDPRKPLVRFTRAGTIELSNVDVSIQVVSKLEDTLIRIFGRGGGFWGTVKARPTLELKPVHTKNGIGFKLVRFKINGTAYDSAGTDISNLAALVGFPKDKAGKLTASDAQVKSAIDGLLSGLQEKFASTLIGLTASGTSASKILATRYDSKGKTATVGFDPKVLGKVGPVFDVDQFGIRGGRLVLGARSEESVEAIAKRNYSMTIDQEGLGEQIGRATPGSAGFRIGSGTQIGGTFGVGSKDKFIRVRGELNDSNVDVQVFIISTRENRITLIPGEVKIQNGNASMAYDAAAIRGCRCPGNRPEQDGGRGGRGALPTVRGRSHGAQRHCFADLPQSPACRRLQSPIQPEEHPHKKQCPELGVWIGLAEPASSRALPEKLRPVFRTFQWKCNGAHCPPVPILEKSSHLAEPEEYDPCRRG